MQYRSLTFKNIIKYGLIALGLSVCSNAVALSTTQILQQQLQSAQQQLQQIRQDHRQIALLLKQEEIHQRNSLQTNQVTRKTPSPKTVSKYNPPKLMPITHTSPPHAITQTENITKETPHGWQVRFNQPINYYETDTPHSQTLAIGGFANALFTHAQGSAQSANSVNNLTVVLLAKADLNSQWSGLLAQAVTQRSYISFNNGNRTSPYIAALSSHTPLEVLWINYRHSASFNVQAGRFITPQGISQMAAFPTILLYPEQQRYLNHFDGHSIIPNFINGIRTYGQWSIDKDNVLGLSAFVGNTNTVSSHAFWGGRITEYFKPAKIKLGLNMMSGARNTALLPSGAYLGNAYAQYHAYSINVSMKYNQFEFQSTYIRTHENLGRQRLAYFIQPAVKLSEYWNVFYRFSHVTPGYLDTFATSNVISTTLPSASQPEVLLHSGGKINENLVGINYQPIHLVQISAQLGFVHFGNSEDTFGTHYAGGHTAIFTLSTTLRF